MVPARYSALGTVMLLLSHAAVHAVSADEQQSTTSQSWPDTVAGCNDSASAQESAAPSAGLSSETSVWSVAQQNSCKIAGTNTAEAGLQEDNCQTTSGLLTATADTPSQPLESKADGVLEGDRSTEDAEVLELQGLSPTEVYAQIQAQSKTGTDKLRTLSHLGRKLAYDSHGTQSTQGFLMHYTLSFYCNTSSTDPKVATLSDPWNSETAAAIAVQTFKAEFLGSFRAFLTMHSVKANIKDVVLGNPMNITIDIYPVISLLASDVDPVRNLETVDYTLTNTASLSLLSNDSAFITSYALVGLNASGSPENVETIARCREFVATNSVFWSGDWTSIKTVLVVVIPITGILFLLFRMYLIWRAKRRAAAAAGTVAAPPVAIGPMVVGQYSQQFAPASAAAPYSAGSATSAVPTPQYYNTNTSADTGGMGSANSAYSSTFNDFYNSSYPSQGFAQPGQTNIAPGYSTAAAVTGDPYPADQQAQAGVVCGNNQTGFGYAAPSEVGGYGWPSPGYVGSTGTMYSSTQQQQMSPGYNYYTPSAPSQR